MFVENRMTKDTIGESTFINVNMKHTFFFAVIAKYNGIPVGIT